MARPRPTFRSRKRLSDDDLCRAVAGGDEAAFAELADRHRAWLVELCRRNLSGDAHRAEDVAQECLIKFHAGLQRDHRPLTPRAWLSVVARNACIDVHRTSHADPTDVLPEAGVEDIDPFEIDPILAEAWEGLTDRQRDVLHHRELMGLSYDDIATVMGTSVGAIETLLFRARAALRRNYQRAGGRLLGCGLFGLSFMRTLDDGGSHDFESHLASCGDCVDAAARLTETTELLRAGSTGADFVGATGSGSMRERLAAAMPSLTSVGAAPQSLVEAVQAAPAVAAAVATVAVVSAGALAVVATDNEPAVVEAASPTTVDVEDSDELVPPLASPLDTVVDVVVDQVPAAIPVPTTAPWWRQPSPTPSDDSFDRPDDAQAPEDCEAFRDQWDDTEQPASSEWSVPSEDHEMDPSNHPSSDCPDGEERCSSPRQPGETFDCEAPSPPTTR